MGEVSAKRPASAAASPKAPANGALTLERFAPYRIVSLAHDLSAALGRAYADEDVTIPEWRVLAVVAQADAVAARDVVQRTPMDKMSVSRAVSSLERKGYAARAVSERDRRLNMVSLTPAGRALFDRIAKTALAFEKDLLSALSAEERRVFDRILTKLSDCPATARA